MAERAKYTTPVVKLALEKKLITPDQHEQCKDLLRKSKKIGLEATIEEIIIKQGLLTTDQVSELNEITELGDGETVFGSYRLVRLIGKGGMGKVYEAVHELTNRTVAVKVLNYNFTRDQNNVTRFFQEIRALAKLSHGNIVTLFDAGKVKRRFFFSMELVDGPSVQEFVEVKKVLPERQALQIVRDSAKALAYAHKKNIVHRDIKPENILLDENKTAKVTDFGVVMHQDADHMTLTKTGFMVGSVFYASPEQVNGLRDIDGRSDIYSLGAMLYYMLSGRTVYSGKTPQEVLTKHLSGTWISPKRYNRAISRQTVRLVRKMMARDRNRRFQSMDDVIAAIDGRGRLQRLIKSFWMLIAAAAVFLAGMAFEQVRHTGDSPATESSTAEADTPGSDG